MIQGLSRRLGAADTVGTAAWHTVALRDMALRLVSRVSSRVFLGEEVCRNPDWLRVTREYTVDGYRAAEELRLWPAPLRYLVHRFLPSCSLARSHVREARRIINGVLEKRRAQERLGEKVQYEDAIEWYVSKPTYLNLYVTIQDR